MDQQIAWGPLLLEPAFWLAICNASATGSSCHVRNKDAETFDIHDRVNYAAESSVLSVDAEKRTLTLELTIDTDMCKIMEYFEIFLERMAMCRRAAEFLDCQFRLVINGTEVL